MNPQKNSGCGAFAHVAFGLILPLAAFGLDSAVQMDPVLWGDFFSGRRSGIEEVGPRQAIVYMLLLISLAGVVASLRPDRRSRWNNAFALCCLTVGVGFATLHAIVFLPIAPVMVVALVFLVGIFGLSPYFALFAWGCALVRVVYDQGAIASARWVALPLLAGVAILALAATPFLYAHETVAAMKTGGPKAISRGFRALGPLVPVARQELVLLYLDLDGPSQVRFRNLYLEEFGTDVNLESRVRGRGWR